MAIHLLATLERDPASAYWKLPLSFAGDGRTILSIRDAMGCKSNVLPIDELSPEQLREVIIARAKCAVVENIPTAYSGPEGHVRSAQEALAEILADTPLGRAIKHIHTRFMLQFFEELQATGP